MVNEGGRRLTGPPEKTDSIQPSISVVTVVLNGKAHLEEAIRSIVGQSYPNVEYIVVDGGSTDGTLDVIRKYEDRIDFWLSEPDEGIYDAINKGIALATGELIGILNSDDRYLPGALEEASRAYRMQTDREVVVAGQWKLVFGDRDPGILLSPSVRFRDLRICHQALFVPKKAYEHIGRYDLRYRYSADLDMAIRLHKNGYRFVLVDKPFVYYRSFGASGRHIRETGKEQSAIIRKHLGFPASLFFRIFRAKTEALFHGYRIITRLFGEDTAESYAKRYFALKERFFFKRSD